MRKQHARNATYETALISKLWLPCRQLLNSKKVLSDIMFHAVQLAVLPREGSGITMHVAKSRSHLSLHTRGKTACSVM